MFRSYPIIAALVFILSLCFAFAANADSIRVVAQVGDEPITSLDVSKRLTLTIITSGFKNTAATRRDLTPQVLDMLIDEALFHQEAKRLKINVTDEEKQKALNSIAQKNHIAPNDLNGFFKKKSIDPIEIHKQLEANLLWQKIIAERIKPNVKISDKELQETIEYLTSSEGLREIKYREISLPITNKNDSDVYKQAQAIITSLKKGVTLEEAAKQFGHSNTNIERVTPFKELPTPLRIAFTSLKKGQISKRPIKVDGQYMIVEYIDEILSIAKTKEHAKMQIKQVFIPHTATSTKESVGKVEERLKRLSQRIKTCNEFTSVVGSAGNDLTIDTLDVTLSDLNPSIAEAVTDLSPNKGSGVVISSIGVHLLAVCKKDKPEFVGITDEDKKHLEEQLFTKKLLLQTKQYLQNLRHRSYINTNL